jgi:hypothetical protein
MPFNFYGIISINKGIFKNLNYFIYLLRFSFWKIEYEKYEGEGEKLYMTRNMANGFL